MPTQVYIFAASAGINTYTLCIGLATLAGIAYALWQARGSAESLSQQLTGLLFIAIAALSAGRTGYVLLHADYFSEHTAEIVSATSPGLWEQAAIAGGVVGWWIAGRVRRPVTATALVISASLIGIGASLGCIPNGCAYGREVFWTNGWVWALRVDWPDAYMLNNPRLPTQVFMIAWLLLCLLLVIASRSLSSRSSKHPKRNGAPTVKVAQDHDTRRAVEGYVVLLWVSFFAIGDFIIQFSRADAQQMFAGLRWSQCADAVLFLASMLYLIVVKIRLPTEQY
jgi:prolipoprotein diacylglyceryltransferase